MNTLKYIIKKYKLDFKTSLPIEIPNVNRNSLAILFFELNFTKGVEVGVQQGLYSEILCQSNPNLKLYGIDPYIYYDHYNPWIIQKRHNEFLEESKKRLAPYNYQLIKKFSMDAVKDFKDDSLDFVYIDGNHNLKYVIEDIVDWTKKVKKGGIISGHDYIMPKHMENDTHVFQAVNTYTKVYRINPWFVLGTKSKTAYEIRDSRRSWFWVK